VIFAPPLCNCALKFRVAAFFFRSQIVKGTETTVRRFVQRFRHRLSASQRLHRRSGMSASQADGTQIPKPKRRIKTPRRGIFHQERKLFAGLVPVPFFRPDVAKNHKTVARAERPQRKSGTSATQERNVRNARAERPQRKSGTSATQERNVRNARGTSATQGGMSATQPLTTERNSVVTARPTTSGASALQKPASLTTQPAENAQRTVAISRENTRESKVLSSLMDKE
jgi:hypothetical protein